MRIISIIQDQLLNGFLKHLEVSGLTSNSIRFYKSDITHFSSWIIGQVRKLGASAESLIDVVPFLKNSMATEYKKYLSSSDDAVKTINRRLSSLRKFSGYLISEEILPFDFTKDLGNISLVSRSQKLPSSLIEDFKKHLEIKKASKNTVKNYIADIRHFLNWIEEKNYAN